MLPAWPGAAESKLGALVLPLFDFRKVGEPANFFGPRDSFGFNILNSSQFRFGPAIKLINEREQWNYKELYGLGNIGYTAQVGVFGEYWPVTWLRLRGEVRQGIGGETGLTGDVFLDAIVPLGQWTLSAGPRIELQSTAAVSPFYSITPSQSGATQVYGPQSGLAPLPVYNATGGFYSWGVGGKAQYTFNPQWAAYSFVEFEQITGSAAGSPLVTQRGSPDQFTYGLGVTYTFTMHPLW
jgi:outer membrane protein